MFIKHKKDCLSINGVQSVRAEKGTVKFENYFKQMPVPFKIYADSYTKKYHDQVLYSFAYKVICIDDRLSKPIVVYRGKNAAYISTVKK